MMVSSCRQLFIEKKMGIFFNLFEALFVLFGCATFSPLALPLTMVSGELCCLEALQHPWVLMEMDAESHKGLPRRVIYSVA